MARFSRSKETDDSTTGTRAARTGVPIRTVVARVVWAVFLICALFLAVGALLIALDANRDNALVRFVLDGADSVDLGIFSRSNGIKHFTGDSAQVKNALFNWGIGAVAYLIVGRILDRVIRP